MSKHYWYSATLRFYIVSSAEGKIRGEESVFLVRATEWDEAFKKFLAVGRRAETAYKNWDGDEIRHRFVGVTIMDCVGDVDLDGVEVSSTPLFEEDPTITFATPLDPDKSVPEHCGIGPGVFEWLPGSERAQAGASTFGRRVQLPGSSCGQYPGMDDRSDGVASPVTPSRSSAP